MVFVVLTVVARLLRRRRRWRDGRDGFLHVIFRRFVAQVARRSGGEGVVFEGAGLALHQGGLRERVDSRLGGHGARRQRPDLVLGGGVILWHPELLYQVSCGLVVIFCGPPQ